MNFMITKPTNFINTVIEWHKIWNCKIQTELLAINIQEDKSRESPPAINHLGVLMFKPPEASPQGALNFAFHRVHLIASNPLLPLKLRVTKSPRVCRSTLPFLELQVPIFVVVVGHLGLCIGGTVGHEFIRSGRSGWRWPIIALHLHIPIPIFVWSVVVSHGILWQRYTERFNF